MNGGSIKGSVLAAQDYLLIKVAEFETENPVKVEKYDICSVKNNVSYEPVVFVVGNK